MSKNAIINVYCFEQEIGKLGYDENLGKSFFQYNPIFLASDNYKNLFPLLIKRVENVQVFSDYNNETFRNLPPMIADSLPDMFGNLIFKTWLESNQKEFQKITPLEQLAYVANRGMGALEYKPSIEIPKNTSINIDEITVVLKKVLENKYETSASQLDNASLLNIFKIGSSAGGIRPKILISEHKITKEIIPGDIEYSDSYIHYLVKLCLDDQENKYNREKVEYSYYLTAKEIGISFMPSKLIDDKHFATERFDRQNGRKKHILTACGMTGWDFTKPDNSSYEKLFVLAIYLKLNAKELNELYKRMVFNLVFCNYDDHLKNHSFSYNETLDNWSLSPAYDVTYSLNPLLNFTRKSRVLSINNKRINIQLEDILTVADEFTIKNPKGIIELVQNTIPFWEEKAKSIGIPLLVIQKIKEDFKLFL